ncbi:hypothetical protein ACFSL6_11315 [Paenibacillus thailandensis]|uniref:Secreted protein n=1 Tax=Paenibacillus thailandensis TaxID=393250 RepID=A0ABW5QTH5_9BACL
MQRKTASYNIVGGGLPALAVRCSLLALVCAAVMLPAVWPERSGREHHRTGMGKHGRHRHSPASVGMLAVVRFRHRGFGPVMRRPSSAAMQGRLKQPSSKYVGIE